MIVATVRTYVIMEKKCHRSDSGQNGSFLINVLPFFGVTFSLIVVIVFWTTIHPRGHTLQDLLLNLNPKCYIHFGTTLEDTSIGVELAPWNFSMSSSTNLLG